jgi:glycosyltransferase involved in cell wall biosynthesis
MKKPKVSVIIPTFNRLGIVKETINAFLRQQNAPTYELVVVDDGSTDNTYDELNNEFINQINQGLIRVLRKPNGGVSTARNFGIENALGEYIAIADSDDPPMPEKLRIQADYLDNHLDRMATHGKVKFIDDNGEPAAENEIIKKINNYYHNNIWDKNLEQRTIAQFRETGSERDPVINSTLFFRKELYDLIKEQTGQGYDPHLRNTEDFDFFIRAVEVAERMKKNIFGFNDEFVNKYRFSTDSKSRQNNIRQRRTKYATQTKQEMRKKFDGKDPKAIVFTLKTDGGIGEVVKNMSLEMFKHGFTGIDMIKQPNWYGQPKSYKFRKIDSHILAGGVDAYFAKEDKRLEDISEGKTKSEMLENVVTNGKYNTAIVHGNSFIRELEMMRRIGTPIINICHSVLKEDLKDYPVGDYHKIEQRQYETFLRSDVIQAISQHQKEKIIEYYPEFVNKVKVVENSSDIPLHASRNERKVVDGRLLYVSRLVKEKRLYQLVDAMTLVIKQRPDATLKIVGIGPLEKKLKKYIKKSGLKNNVKLLGWKNKEKLAKQYAKAEAYVHPSSTESWGMGTHDAINYKIPIICNNFNGLLEKLVAGEDYASADSNNPREFANAILRTLQDKDKSKKMARNAMSKMSYSSWRTSASRQIDVIKELEGEKVDYLESMTKADRALGKRDYSSALQEYEKAARSGDKEAMIGMGRVFKETGRYEDAVRIFNYVIEKNPDDEFTSKYHLASTLRLKGETDKSIEMLEQLDKNNPWVCFNLGRAYQAKGETNKMRECFKRTLEIRPNFKYKNNLSSFLI